MLRRFLLLAITLGALTPASAQICVSSSGAPLTTTGGIPLLCTGSGGPNAGPAYDPYPRVYANAGGGDVAAYITTNWTTYSPLYNAIHVANYVGSEASIGDSATYKSVFQATLSASPLKTPPRLGQYVINMEATQPGEETASTYNAWVSQIATGTGSYAWWLLTSWPSGSNVVHDTNDYDTLLSPNNTGTNTSGRNFFQQWAYHFDEVLSQGTADGETSAPVANSDLTLYFIDNQFSKPRETGTWGAPTDPNSYSAGATANAYLQQAQAKAVAAMRVQHPGIILAGNTDYYDYGTASGGSVVLDPSNDGLYDYAFAEQVEAQWGSHSASTLMAMLEQGETQVNSTGTLVVSFYFNGTGSGCPSVVSWTGTAQSSWGANQWQVWRATAAMTFMRNWTYAPGAGPSNTLYWGDELGQPLTTNPGWLSNGTQRLDPPQTAPNGPVTLTGTGNVSNVWVRRFPNGWVLWNPYGNGSVTITNIPTTLFHIADPFGGQSGTNTGAQVTGGSVTLGDSISSEPCGDGLFLIGTG